jgi:hypothetical protein
MLQYVGHGGGCCGYYHVHNFDNATIAELDAHITTHNRQTNRVLEAILTDRQLVYTTRPSSIRQEVFDAGGWAAILRARGFFLNLIWVNSNTRRTCYQFLNIPTPLSLDEARLGGLPGWDGQGPVIYHNPPVDIRHTAPVERPAPAPVPAHDVLVEYFCIFQGGRIGTRSFTTVAELQNEFPRVQRYRKRTFRSDGRIVNTDAETLYGRNRGEN